MKRHSAEVFFSTERVSRLTTDGIRLLKEAALGTPRRRARLCTHGGIEEILHEMFIVHTRETYVRPHKHVDKAESLCILEGTADLLLFDDAGSVVERTRMGRYGSGDVFYTRISEPRYHSLLVTSDVLIFHETTSGPWAKEETVFAPWSPEDGSPFLGEYLAGLHGE